MTTQSDAHGFEAINLSIREPASGDPTEAKITIGGDWNIAERAITSLVQRSLNETEETEDRLPVDFAGRRLGLARNELFAMTRPDAEGQPVPIESHLPDVALLTTQAVLEAQADFDALVVAGRVPSMTADSN